MKSDNHKESNDDLINYPLLIYSFTFSYTTFIIWHNINIVYITQESIVFLLTIENKTGIFLLPFYYYPSKWPNKAIVLRLFRFIIVLFLHILSLCARHFGNMRALPSQISNNIRLSIPLLTVKKTTAENRIRKKKINGLHKQKGF